MKLNRVKKSVITVMALILSMGAMTGSAFGSTLWFQGFEYDSDGWLDSANGWYGTIDRVSSGMDGITSATGGWHAVIDQSMGTAPFSQFDQYRDFWPGDYLAEIDVYLDPTWTDGAAFDYTVAVSNPAGNHRRDFIFHIESYGEGDLRIGATNNTNFVPQGNLDPANQIPGPGWYRLQHVFYEAAGGVLAVDMNLVDDEGNIVFTETRSNATDIINDTVGGNRYSWFTFSTVEGLAVDNHRLAIVVALPADKDDCRNGGFADFGFENQGLCIASIQANERAGR